MDQPELYNKMKSQTVRDGTEFLEGIKKKIKWEKCEKILDVGCGPGGFTRNVLLPFVPQDATLEACDVSEKMINFACNSFKHPRIVFKVLDIQSTDNWDCRESYTKIFSFFLFHWITNYRETFRNMYSLLKPSGEMYSLFFAEQKIFLVTDEMRNTEPWRNYIKGPVYQEWYINKTIEERKEMFLEEMNAAGFKEIEIDVKKSEFAYASMEQFTQLAISTDPYRKYVPDQMIKEYDRIFAEKVRRKATLEPETGRAAVSNYLFVVRAKKL